MLNTRRRSSLWIEARHQLLAVHNLEANVPDNVGNLVKLYPVVEL